MRKTKQFFFLFTLLVIALTSYKLLLTVQNVPTTSIQDSHINSLDFATDHIAGKQTLRQLLQDQEITQLPVKIITDCLGNQSTGHHLYSVKTSRFVSTNKNVQDSDIVCLNETHLYEESLAQYGVPFGELTILQQKASIRQAVLNDMEHKNQFKITNKVDVFVTEDESNRKTTNYVSEQEKSSENSPIEMFDDKAVANKVSEGLVVLSHGPKTVRKPKSDVPNVHRSRVLQGSVTKHTTEKKKITKPLKMKNDLIKLKGVRVKQSLSLVERGFSDEWGVSSTLVKKRLKHITMAINDTFPSERSVTKTSLNPDLLQRAKFQKDQVDLFCQQHTHPPSTLPLENTELESIFRHLLYDDTRKMVFCYVPKNGCSNMKRMMLVLNGILPPDASKGKRPPESLLKQVHSFSNLTSAEALYRLKYYLKLVIVRNPLERLLSAYKNKLEKPFVANLRRFFPERLKAFILKRYRRKEFEAWITNNNSTDDIHPNFDEFVQFMNNFPLSVYNEHFEPFLELCNPCAVKFDFFLSFKTLEYDIYALMEYLNIPFGLYPESIAHKSDPTASLLEDYYATVSPTHKAQLFRRFSRELAFYYSLHPEEWGTNSNL